MRHSPVDKRASKRPAKQCVSDHGMHKDAAPVERAGETWSFKPRTGRVIFSAAPGTFGNATAMADHLSPFHKISTGEQAP